MRAYATENFPPEDQEALLQAAESWRLPYWDWAAKKPDDSGKYDYNIPVVFQKKEVEIRLPPPQAPGPYPNALYQFTMPQDLTMGDRKLPEIQRIVRRVNFDDTITAVCLPPLVSRKKDTVANANKSSKTARLPAGGRRAPGSPRPGSAAARTTTTSSRRSETPSTRSTMAAAET